jgi:hypothetical protein
VRRPPKKERPTLQGKRWLKNIMKLYDRSHYVIENKEGHVETKPKRTQNELTFEHKMRALNTLFELFGAAHVPAGHSDPDVRRRSKSPEWGESRGIARENKNRGNELKEYLKTKDITFSKAANPVPLARNGTAI